MQPKATQTSIGSSKLPFLSNNDTDKCVLCFAQPPVDQLERTRCGFVSSRDREREREREESKVLGFSCGSSRITISGSGVVQKPRSHNFPVRSPFTLKLVWVWEEVVRFSQISSKA